VVFEVLKKTFVENRRIVPDRYRLQHQQQKRENADRMTTRKYTPRYPSSTPINWFHQSEVAMLPNAASRCRFTGFAALNFALSVFV
jgi:hypothetical protein